MLLKAINRLKFLFFILVLGSFIYFVPVFYFLNLAVASLVYPFLVVQNKIVLPAKNYLRSFSSLINENDLLRQERDKFLAKNIKHKSIKHYYHNIKEIVDFKKNYKFKDSIFSQVLMKSFLSNENFFFLNKGSNSGVKVDMVAVFKNNLLGRVSEVFPYYSKLTLITDKSCKVAVYCSKTKTKGVHRGNNNKNESKLMYISHLNKVKDGDLLISSGEGLIFPQGFALGKIKSFLKKEVQFKVKVEPLVDFSMIEYCYLIEKI
jgi:rod shape-determining protein MreC